MFCEQASFDISVEFLRYMLHIEAHVTLQICEIIINFFQLVVGSSRYAFSYNLSSAALIFTRLKD